MDKEKAKDLTEKIGTSVEMALTTVPVDSTNAIDYLCLAANPKPGEVINVIAKLRKALDESKATTTELQKAYDLLTQAYVPEYVDELGVELLTTKEHRLEVRNQMRVNLLAENREAFHKWLTKHKLKHMITATVNSSTLKAWVKDAMENKLEYPGELLKIEPYRQAVLVKR